MVYGFKDKEISFKSLVENDNLGQAYLFFGEPQIGKFHFTKHLAYLLEYGEFDILEKPLVDTVVVSAVESNIGLDDLSHLRKFLSQKPFKSSKRLIILDDCHKLTPHAASSLLKFVEEASDHTTFIFIGPDPQVLLPPLASRLMKIYFSKLSKKEVKNVLMEKFNVSENKATEVAMKSFGRLGLALDILKGDADRGDDINEFINDKIKKLYLGDKEKNAGKIKKLLNREEDVVRFNTNPRIQKKAVEFDLKN